jgi:hypothetical protein
MVLVLVTVSCGGSDGGGGGIVVVVVVAVVAVVVVVVVVIVGLGLRKAFGLGCVSVVHYKGTFECELVACLLLLLLRCD